MLMNAVRAGWIVLVGVCVGLGVLAATSPMMSITTCELGLPDAGVMPGEECETAIARYYGPSIVAALSVPALLCLLPAIFPRRRIAGLVAALLAIGSLGAALQPAPLFTFGYFIPAAVLAVVLAAWQAWQPDRPARP